MDRRDTIRLVMPPTPFEQMPRSPALGRDGQVPSIWIKRDDCTGFAGGGNKGRKLEYLVADALNHGRCPGDRGAIHSITLARPQLQPRATGLGACCF